MDHAVCTSHWIMLQQRRSRGSALDVAQYRRRYAELYNIRTLHCGGCGWIATSLSSRAQTSKPNFEREVTILCASLACLPSEDVPSKREELTAGPAGCYADPCRCQRLLSDALALAERLTERTAPSSRAVSVVLQRLPPNTAYTLHHLFNRSDRGLEHLV